MLKGKTIYIPPVDYDSARVLAAAFRAAGLEAEPLPPSDERTREVRDRYTTGDECHPFQILAGDVMKLLEGGDVDPAQTAFLLPASDGPCRFSRFVPDLREILERSGYGQAEIFAPDISNVYRDLEELGEGGVRTAWRALISADILRRLLLLYRPYEIGKGATDKAYEDAFKDLCTTIESGPVATLTQFEAIRSSLRCIRDSFRAISVKNERCAPLIGIVGETFCRFNPLLNNDLIRQLEDRGGQAWLTGLTKEVRRCVRTIPHAIEELDRDEVMFNELFRDDFSTCSEPDTGEVLEYAKPYLPVEDGFGEVALRLGQIVHMAKQGVDGIIDASPFPCMNVSPCAAFYPKLSRDLDGLPIRNFYCNGAKHDWSIALDEYLGITRAYRERRIGGRI